MIFKVLNILKEFRELATIDDEFAFLVQRHGGIAEVHTGFEGMGDAGLSAHHDAVVDGDVSGHAGLASEDAVFADLCGTRDADLRRHTGPLAHHHVVCDLDEIVDLHIVLDFGRAHRSAVDAGIRANFHIVADNHIADLRNLEILTVLGSEAETVGTDDGTCVQDAVVADFTTGIDFDTGVERGAVSDLDIVTEAHLRIDAGAIAHHDVFANADELANIDILPILAEEAMQALSEMPTFWFCIIVSW